MTAISLAPIGFGDDGIGNDPPFFECGIPELNVQPRRAQKGPRIPFSVQHADKIVRLMQRNRLRKTALLGCPALEMDDSSTLRLRSDGVANESLHHSGNDLRGASVDR